MKKSGNSKKAVVLVLAAAVLLAAVVWYGYGRDHGKDAMQENKMAYRQITPQQAKEKMEMESDIIVLDVRTQKEYETGHIKNAVCLPNEEIISDPEMLPDKDRQILVYCRSGNRSKQAAQKLAQLGYTNVFEFGGIIDWPYDKLLE